jgi:Sigma-70 region 2
MLAEQTVTDTASTALNVAEIVDHYAGMLYGIGRRYRLTAEECDDAAQSTWLALCQNADRIRAPHRIPGWLATTMRRSASTAVRRRHRELPASDWIDGSSMIDGVWTWQTASPGGTQHSGCIKPSSNCPTGNDASSGYCSTPPNRDTPASVAPYPFPSAASARSAAAPCAGSEPSSMTSNSAHTH